MPDESDSNTLGGFLRARRGLLVPEMLGIQTTSRRRVKGLTRAELATRARISTEYYVRLEQGRDRHPSLQVVESLASALELDESSMTFLHTLARAVPRRNDADLPERAPASILRLMRNWSTTPSFVVGRFGDILAASPAVPYLTPACRPGSNMLREIFLDPDARRHYVKWWQFTAVLVGGLRLFVGQDTDDPRLSHLIDELSAGSARFRELWNRYDVQPRGGGTTLIDHPIEGRLTLDVVTLGIREEAGLTIVVYSAPAGTVTAAAIDRAVADNGADPIEP